MSDESIVDSNGESVEDKFKFYVEAKLIGRKIVGVSFSQQEVEGKTMFVFDINLDDGNWVAVACNETPSIWISRPDSRMDAPTGVM